jgi:cytochrome P450
MGAGVHYCLGAALAKQEIGHAVSAVVSKFPDLKVLEPPTLKGSFNVRGPGRLLVSCKENPPVELTRRCW